MPYEPILLGSLVVCTRCRDGDGSRSPLWPKWLMGRHEAWHDRQDRQQDEPPVLECAS